MNSERGTAAINPAFEDKLFLSAFMRVLGILGEQSKDLVLLEIERKYGFSLQSTTRPITPSEIEDTIEEVFEVAGDLIMTMVKAEYNRIS